MFSRIIIVFIVSFVGFGVAAGQTGSVQISEASLAELFKKSQNSRFMSLKAEELMMSFHEASFQDQFRPVLNGHSGLSENLMKPYQQGQVRSSPVFSTGLSLSQALSKGVRWEAGLTGGQRRDHINLPGMDASNKFFWSPELSLTVDLWKDFLGRSTGLSETSVAYKKEMSEIQTDLEKKLLFNQVRRIYWELVALEDKRQIIIGLHKSAEALTKLSKKKERLSVADQGEVALNQAQLAQRTAQLTELDYQHTMLTKTLSELIPELNGKTIGVRLPDLMTERTKILQCTQKISSYTEFPKSYSLYSTLSALRDKDLAVQTELNRTYGKPDLYFKGSWKNQNSNEKNTDAFRDSWKENQLESNYMIGLTVPLGPRDKAREYQVQAAEYQTKAKVQAWTERMQAGHNSVLDQIKYLNLVLEEQKKNSAFLDSRLKSSKQKFEQARLDASVLILDQERMMNTDLSIISLQLQVVNVLLSYFDLYTDFPCDFNEFNI